MKHNIIIKPLRSLWRTIFVAFIGTGLVGCEPSNSRSSEPDQIKVITPDPQYGAAGEQQKVSVEVLTAPVRGLLGGGGVRRPVVNERLLIRPVTLRGGIKSDIAEGLTDAGGRLDFAVTLGKEFGDQYLEVISTSRPTVKKRLRFVSGIRVANNRQEIVAGQPLSAPFRLTLLTDAAQPLRGVPVYFSIATQPGKGATVSPTMGLTDEDGIVEVDLHTAPGVTGIYQVSAEISDPENGHVARPIRLEANVIHIAGLILGVLGGLAILIYGITLMSDGLQQIAGNRLKRVLAFITSNHVRAVLAGATVTGLIQSSSSTTIMTVGFVNAGLLTLKQAIGVIFGANIGTTITGQLVSFKLSNMAQPAIALGVLLMLLLKRPSGQGFARAILGFGLLFFGMEMMSGQLEAVSGYPTFVRVFQMIDCTPQNGVLPLPAVLGAICIGMIATGIVQSSAATIGLAIALANSGLLNIWTAVPIILGDNIGTTLTAIFASLSASRTARQAAVAHSLFNILGSLTMIALFYVPISGVPCFFFLVDIVTGGNVFMGENVGRHVAAAHSMFNVVSVLIFTPLITPLAWLCSKVVPEPRAVLRQPLVNLDRSWLTSPSLALDGAVRATAVMTERACGLAAVALECYRSGKEPPMADLKNIEDDTDETQHQIMDYLMQLTRRKLSASQAEAIPALMHCVSDAERIADIGLALADLMIQQPSEGALTQAAQQELDLIAAKTNQLVECVLNGLRNTGKNPIELAIRLEGQVRMLCKRGEHGHIDRLQRGECTIDRGIVYVEVLALIEAIVRHLGNIATRTEIATSDVN